MDSRALPSWATRPVVGRLAGLSNRQSAPPRFPQRRDRKSTRLNSSHTVISYAVFCLKKKIADQNWMGSLGKPSERHKTFWLAVKDGRDAAISLLEKRLCGNTTVRGGQVADGDRDIGT